MDEHLLRFRKDKKLVFIDCETYNLCLNFCHNVAWQISMISTDGTYKKDERDFYIKWDTPFNIIGFDIYLIKEMYKMFGEDYKHLVPKLIDTNCIARGVKMEIPYKPEEDFTEYQYRIVNTRRKGVRSSLTALGKEFNIDHDYDKLHNAIVDLELNLKVWNKLKYALEL